MTSEIFQRILKNINKYDFQKGKLEVWIFTIAGNKVKDYYRTKNKFKLLSIEAFADFFESEKAADDDILRLEEYEYLRKKISKLPDRQRQILSYKYGAELSNKDIAQILDISISNVGVVLHRTIKDLKKEMEDYYE